MKLMSVCGASLYWSSWRSVRLVGLSTSAVGELMDGLGGGGMVGRGGEACNADELCGNWNTDRLVFNVVIMQRCLSVEFV